MKKQSYLIAIILLAVLQPYRSNAQNNLEKLVRNAFDTIKTLAQQPNVILQFDHSDQMNTESHEQGKVIVNLEQVRQILQTVEPAYKKDIIRLIIGHEIGHQVQFHTPNNGKFSPVLNECQADLLAGFFLFQISINDVFEQYKNVPNLPTSEDDPRLKAVDLHFIEISLAGVSAIFNLGDDFTKDNTHPRNEQRRVAVRDGYYYGMLWLCDAELHSPGIKPNLRTELYNKEDSLKAVLNFLPMDDVMTWSYRHAKNIVHYQYVNCKNIVVYSDWKWDTSSDNPYCEYAHTIQNIGTDIIALNFEDQIYTALRSDPNNSFYWSITSSQPHSLTLQPGEIKAITGKIRWVANQNLEPYLIKIGDPSSLYSCVSLNYPEPDVKDYMHAIANPTHKPSLENVFDVILSERDLFDTYIEGVGQSEIPDDFKVVYYQSRLKVPFAENSRIEFHRTHNNYNMLIDIYKGKRDDIAKKKIDTLLSILKTVQPSYQYHKLNGDPEITHWMVYDDASHLLGTITLMERPEKNDYEASFLIYGKKKT